MANFNQSTWYQLNVAGSKQSMAGTALYNQGKGAVFFANTNTSDPQQKWQLFPFNSSYYVLRTKESGKFGYMSTNIATDESTPGDTVPSMRNVTLTDNSMFWTISPWGDGTFYLTNAANGTDWHLNVKSNSLLSMSSNTTAPQTGQSFSFTQQGDINNMPGFSSVTVPSTISTSSSTPAPTTSIPAATTSSSSSGLSTGAKAGIGAGVAVAALIALVAIGFWFLRRRKRSSQSPSSFPLTSDYSNERKSIVPSGAQEFGPFSDMGRNRNVEGHPQELDPATAAMYEMEAGKERERKGRSVSPYRPGVDREQKAVMPEGFFRDHVVHEMDALPRPVERVELPVEDEGR